MSIQVSGITDIGIRRTINQDAYIYRTSKVHDEYVGIYAVADGVGGLELGEHASSIAIHRIDKWWNLELPKHYGKIENVIKSLVRRIEIINNDITIFSESHDCNMATTLSLLLIYKNMYYVLHIGDSKIFKINKGISQITVDHLVEKKLSQYLGGRRKVFEYHLSSGQIRSNDYFIIGSDGTFNRVTKLDLQGVISDIEKNGTTLEEGCLNLVHKVKGRGETDNITVILVNVK